MNEYDERVEYHSENVLDQRLTTLEWEFLKCCNCGSQRELIIIPTLHSDVWCYKCADETDLEE